MSSATVRWRRLDLPGHDSARLARAGSDWSLTGLAVFTHDERPCRLAYGVTCDASWRTRAARVTGWIGRDWIERAIRADAEGRWFLDEAEVAAVHGCHDVDLAFTPATNLLPIRRLGLAIGQAAPVAAAWLRFPELRLERRGGLTRNAAQHWRPRPR